VIDVYKRLLNKSENDAHYLLFSRLAVAFCDDPVGRTPESVFEDADGPTRGADVLPPVV